MSSPIELMRQGIIASDWRLVCDGFNMMTCMNLSPPAQTSQPQCDSTFLYGIRDQINAYLDLDGMPPTAVPEPRPPIYPVYPKEAEAPEVAEISLIDDGPQRVTRDVAQPVVQVQQEEVVDPVSARARAVRDNRDNRGGDEHRFDPNNLKTASASKREARKLSWEPPTGNRFKDNPLVHAREAQESKIMSQTVTPEPRRPRVPKVTVKCFKCGMTEQVEACFAPRNIDPAGRDENTYQCNGCIRKVL